MKKQNNEIKVFIEAKLMEDGTKQIGWLTVINGKAYVSNHKSKNGIVHTPIKSITQWIGIRGMDNIFIVAKAGVK